MILIAKCKTGFPCRYHGRPVESPALIRKIKNLPHQFICPECEAGLPIPRPPIHVRDGKYLLGGKKDITALLQKYCLQKAEMLALQDIVLFIGVKDSPCCDPDNGLFTKYLQRVGIKSSLQLLVLPSPILF